MEYLFFSFLFLFTLNSAQSINNDNLNLSPNIAPASYFSYPPGYENDNAPQTQFSSDSISPIASDQSDSFGLQSSLISTNMRKYDGISSNVDPIIKKICDNTDYPDLCTATVSPFMRGSIINVQNVLQVALKQSSAFAKLGFATFKRASESRFTPPKTKKMLKACLDSWDSALYNYEKAIEALRIHDSGRMSTMLSAAITDISDCEDAFEGLISPMSGYSQRMTKMTSNCLAIVSQITT